MAFVSGESASFFSEETYLDQRTLEIRWGYWKNTVFGGYFKLTSFQLKC